MTDDHSRIDELIERSSLGTAGARRLRRRTPADIAQDLVDDVGAIAAETREAAMLLADAVDYAQEAARAAIQLIRPLVLRYCHARVQRGDLVFEQAETITDAACMEIERDLVTQADLADESRLLSHTYQVTSQHVRNAYERSLHETGKPERTPRVDAALTAAINQLNPVEREVLVLRVIGGLSAAETSETLGIRPAAVRRLQHSALRALRHKIEPTHEQSPNPVSIHAKPDTAARRPDGPTARRQSADSEGAPRIDRPVTAVLIADRAPVSENVRLWCLAAQPRIHLVDVSATAADAETVARARADVVILNLPSAAGAALGNVRRFVDAGKRVVIYTQVIDRHTAALCISLGARAYVTESEGPEHLAAAVHAAAAGELYTSPSLAGAILADDHPTRPHLAPTEVEALRRWFTSSSKRMAAQSLGIPVRTLDTYITRARMKYAEVGRSAASKSALVARTLQHGIFTLEDLE